jgi:hypothetical protein
VESYAFSNGCAFILTMEAALVGFAFRCQKDATLPAVRRPSRVECDDPAHSQSLTFGGALPSTKRAELGGDSESFAAGPKNPLSRNATSACRVA